MAASGCQFQCRLTIFVPPVDVGTATQKKQDYSLMSVRGCRHQGGDSVVILVIDLRACIQKCFHDGNIPRTPSENQGGLATISTMFNLRTVRQKFLYDGRLASALSRLDQGRVAGPVGFLKVDGNPFVQEAPDLSEIAN
jgi:hypothetical protein